MLSCEQCHRPLVGVGPFCGTCEYLERKQKAKREKDLGDYFLVKKNIPVKPFVEPVIPFVRKSYSKKDGRIKMSTEYYHSKEYFQQYRQSQQYRDSLARRWSNPKYVRVQLEKRREYNRRPEVMERSRLKHRNRKKKNGFLK